MSSRSADMRSLIPALIPAAILLLALLLAFDPQVHEDTKVSGIIVGNIQQVGDIKNPEESVQVRLANGLLVNATITPVSGFPYRIGTPVQVTPYRSMLFGKRSYQALAETR